MNGRFSTVSAWLKPVAAFAAALLGAAASMVILVELSPGDATDAIGTVPSDVAEIMRREWCIGCPWYQQVAERVTGMLSGDFGTSLAYRRGSPVLELVWPALLRSLTILLIALVIGLLAGAGGVVARRVGGRPGRMMVSLGAFASTVPAFLVGIVVWRVGAPLLGLDVGPTHLLVAAVILGFADAGFADLSSRLHAEVRAAEATDHVVAARANGDRARRIMARTLAGPVLELSAARFSVLLGAVMMVEIPLGIYGIGELMAGAAASRDVPVVVGSLMLLAAAVCTVQLLKDLARTGLDPRLRRPVVER